MSQNTQGQIPDGHFENEPGPTPATKPQLSRALLDHIAAVKEAMKQTETESTAT
jgi:hypothetical protein